METLNKQSVRLDYKVKKQTKTLKASEQKLVAQW